MSSGKRCWMTLSVSLVSGCGSAQAPPDAPLPRARAQELPVGPRHAASAPLARSDAGPEDRRRARLEDLEPKIDALMTGSAGWRRRRTPLLPCSWPPSGACVQLFLYESSPLPTGTIQLRYRGPLSRIECSLEPLACVVVPAEGELDELVEMQHGVSDEPGRAAQQVVVSMMQEGEMPERPPDGLEPYARWFDGGAFGASVRRRVPGFAAWIEGH